MGCSSCAKAKARAEARTSKAGNAKYVVVLPSGERKYYDSEAAAKIENRRNGGKGLVKKVV